MLTDELIKAAESKYPAAAIYRGYLTEDEIIEIEKSCSINCLSVFMDGSGTYSIRAKKQGGGKDVD